jgi:hypothetical protein
MWVAPELDEVVPPDEPLDAPLTPSRRTSEVQVVLRGDEGHGSEDGMGSSAAHGAAAFLSHRRRRHERFQSGDGRSRSLSREPSAVGGSLYDAEAILDSLLPQLAFSTSTAMRVDESSGLVLNREEILAAYQESVVDLNESMLPLAGIVL